MHEAIRCLGLTEAESAFLYTIEAQMGIVADLSRADILLYGQQSPHEAVVVAHARPHSLAHVYVKGREGRVVDANRRPEVLQALAGKPQKEHRSFIAEGAPVIRQALPIYYPPQEGPTPPALISQALRLHHLQPGGLGDHLYRRRG